MKQLFLFLAITLLSCGTCCAQTPSQESFIKKELAKYIKDGRRNRNVILTRQAREELQESSWPEIQCNKTGDLDSVGPHVTVKKVGRNAYRYECDCTCGKERYVDNWIIYALYVNGKVKIQRFTVE